MTERAQPEPTAPGDDFYRRLCAQAAVALIATDADFRIVCWNDAARNLLGSAAQEMLGKSILEAVPVERRPTVEKLLDHIDHAVKIGGVDTVGIGSDFDGGGTLLKDAAVLPELSGGLLARGYSREDVEKILGGNFLRVLAKTIG